MKTALIYTAKTEELKESLEKSIRDAFGQNTEIAGYQDLSVLQETVKNGFITKEAGSRYGALCIKAVTEGAEAILSTCCVMGDDVEPLKCFMQYLGVPFYSVDESFCRHALLESEKICLLATAGVAAFSVGHTIERYERILGQSREKRVVIAQGTAGLSSDDFARKLIENIGAGSDPSEGVILPSHPWLSRVHISGNIPGKKFILRLTIPHPDFICCIA